MQPVLFEKIVHNEELVPSIFKLVFKSEYIAQNAKPGQFVNIKCCEGINTILRRPISICDVDRDNNYVTIVYQKRGKGTEYLSRAREGDTLNVIGPLGRSFEMSDRYKNIAVVGGGIGIFPLLFLLKESKTMKKTAFIGFRNKENYVLIDEFERYANDLFISTDDGSFGYKGFITDLFENGIANEKFDIIYTCGPEAMMEKVVKASYQAGIPCQVSLEQRMGCGIGACLACVCRIKIISESEKENSNKSWHYKRVCKDGPVFWGHEWYEWGQA
ncbi:MAG TPA: dihydroorotate dehydrogenase electron transfer subunit [Clostridiaceae bacterium]|nr:dihydroorotate dehydrogenase electron transfer subunit [Clostridiaceae bacterium]